MRGRRVRAGRSRGQTRERSQTRVLPLQLSISHHPRHITHSNLTDTMPRPRGRRRYPRKAVKGAYKRWRAAYLQPLPPSPPTRQTTFPHDSFPSPTQPTSPLAQSKRNHRHAPGIRMSAKCQHRQHSLERRVPEAVGATQHSGVNIPPIHPLSTIPELLTQHPCTHDSAQTVHEGQIREWDQYWELDAAVYMNQLTILPRTSASFSRPCRGTTPSHPPTIHRASGPGYAFCDSPSPDGMAHPALEA